MPNYKEEKRQGITNGRLRNQRVIGEWPLPISSTGSNGHERDDRLLIEADVEIAFGSGDRAGLHSGQFRDDGRICVGDACPF